LLKKNLKLEKTGETFYTRNGIQAALGITHHHHSQYSEELMPMFNDACKLLTVPAMLTDDDAHTVVTEESVLTRKEAIIADIIEYQTRIKWH
jgi:hypothetical protein